MILLHLPLRSCHADSISHLHAQPSLCTLIQNCLFGIFRKCSLCKLRCWKHFQKLFVKPTDCRLDSLNPITVSQMIIQHPIPRDMFHLRPCFQKRSLFFIHQKTCMPASIALNRLYHLGTNLHIRHPKDHRNQKHCQHDTEPGHPVLFLMLFRRYLYQIQIMLQSATPPSSISSPSVTWNTRSAWDVRFILWVIIKTVC